MKTILLLSLSLLITVTCSAQEWNEEQKAIITVIQEAYAEGLQNEGDAVKIDKGFHPDFNLLGKGTEEALRKYPIDQWRARQIEAREKGKLPRPAAKEVSLEFVFIDITKEVAVTKLNYFEGKENTYVDYISLYKYDKGWKIVSKIYHTIKQ